MTNRRAGGYALIGIALATVVIFMIHPTRVDRELVMGLWGLNSFTHTLALAYIPAIALGFVAPNGSGLTGRWCDWRWRSICWRWSLTLAPLVSGFIVADAFTASEGAGRLAVAFNRAFDRGYVGFSAAAMMLNALALPRGHRVWKWLTLPAALGPLVWLASGDFHPDPHAMLLLAVAQGGWFVGAGRTLLSADRAD